MDYQDEINKYIDLAKLAELNGDLETAEAYRAEAQGVSKQMDEYDIAELNTDLEVVKWQNGK